MTMIGKESKSKLLQTLERADRQAGRQREGKERENQSKASSRKGGDEWTGQQGPRPHLKQWPKKRFVFPWLPQTRQRAKQNKTKHTNFFAAHHKPYFLF
jgi:hypothetical protein